MLWRAGALSPYASLACAPRVRGVQQLCCCPASSSVSVSTHCHTTRFAFCLGTQLLAKSHAWPCSPSPASCNDYRHLFWCVQSTRLLSFVSRLGRQARRQGGSTTVRAAREASEQVEQTGTSTDQPDGRKQPESGAGTLASSAAGLLLWAAFVGAPSMHAFGACKLRFWVKSMYCNLVALLRRLRCASEPQPDPGSRPVLSAGMGTAFRLCEARVQNLLCCYCKQSC